MTLRAIGVVRSAITDPAAAPKQGDEDGPAAWLDLDPAYAAGLAGLAPGDGLWLLTWLHLAERDVLRVHPRGDDERPLTGVFATRSPARPNPVGLHRVTVLAVDGASLRVAPLEAIDGTPLIDIKPVMDSEVSGR
jgi:tRNA-Thr(GGU) m(6)t(6)A37 methyltransferase TsaA